MTKEEFYNELDWSEWTRENEFRFSKPTIKNCNLYVAVGIEEDEDEGKKYDAMFFWVGRNHEYLSDIITERLEDLEIVSRRVFRSRKTNDWYRTMLPPTFMIAGGNSLLPVYFW